MDEDVIRKEWQWAEMFIKRTGRPDRLFGVEKERSSLVIVDMQNAFVAPSGTIEASGARETVDNINIMAGACRDAGIPVIWVVSKFRTEADWGLIIKFEPGSPISPDRCSPLEELKWDAEGAKLWPELVVDAEKDYEIIKCRYSAFISGSSNLERLLRTLQRDNLIITGVATNACVAATAMDAMMLDFKVTVVRDATAAFTDTLKQAYLMNLKMVFADVLSTAEILEEIRSIT